MSQFARHFRRSSEVLGPEDIRAYQHHLVHERKLSASSLFVAVGALRFLYKVTLKKDWPIATIIGKRLRRSNPNGSQVFPIRGSARTGDPRK